jgi:hypothetical protein
MPDIFENGVDREITYQELQAKLRAFIKGGQHWVMATFNNDNIAVQMLNEFVTPKSLADRAEITLARFQAGTVRVDTEYTEQGKVKILPLVLLAIVSKKFLRSGALLRHAKKFGLDLTRGVESKKPMVLIFDTDKTRGEYRSNWLINVLEELTNSKSLTIKTVLPGAEEQEETITDNGGQEIPTKESLKIIRQLIDSGKYWTFAFFRSDSKSWSVIKAVVETLPPGTDHQTCYMTSIPLGLFFVNKNAIKRERVFDILKRNPNVLESSVDKQHFANGEVFILGDDDHPPEEVQKLVMLVYSLTQDMGSPTPKPPGFNNPENN